MKTQEEITKAHDLLVQLLLDELPGVSLDEKGQLYVNAAAGVLCWVLGHDHNTTFAENMAKFRRRLAELGYAQESIQ